MKTSSKEDADELAQEIAYELLKAVRKNPRVDNPNAFLWSLSNHVFCNWLRGKRHSDAVLYDAVTEDIRIRDIQDSYELKEEINFLRREISMLSEKYRKCVIFYYFEGLSCEEIAKRLSRSVGTVKWWLHEARNIIKEGMTDMREYGEKSFNPGSLTLSCQFAAGANGEPMSLVRRKSTQNILLAAYKEPVSVNELCSELGIPAAYIEDELDSLTDERLMIKVGKDKYQTDFVILPGRNLELMNKIYKACFPGYYDALKNFLDGQKEKLSSTEYNISGFTWERLLWVYLHMFSEIYINYYRVESCGVITWENVPLRKNGGRWIAIGYDNSIHNPQNAGTAMPYDAWDGPVQKPCMKPYEDACVQGFFHHWSGADSSDFFEIPNEVFILCRDIIKGEISIDALDETREYYLSLALEKKLLTKTNGGLVPNYCYIGKEAFAEIYKIAFEFYKTAKKYLDTAWKIILSEYESGVPKHLRDQMGNFLTNNLNGFVTCSLYEGVNRGDLSQPDEFNKKWISMYQIEPFEEL